MALQIDTKKDPATKLVFDILAERQRSRARTDIKSLFRQALKSNDALDYEAFKNVFKELEASGAGSLIIGRRRNPDRFAWKYNLKHVAEAVKTSGISKAVIEELANKPLKAVVEPNKPVNVKMKGKIKAKVKPQRKATRAVKAKGNFLHIDLNTMRPEDVKALVELVTSVKR